MQSEKPMAVKLKPVSIPVCDFVPVPEELLLVPLVEERPINTYGEPVDLSLECLAIIDIVRDNHAAIRKLGQEQ